jgi:hypothetical protein
MTDGITKHHDRDELHGITVVVNGTSGRTYVGRWHERQPRGVVMRDVAILEPGQDAEAWLSKLAKFGVPPEHRMLVVPEEEMGEVRRFG